jgi:glycosyltransferase involved in cell wall biosynthesis
MSLPPISILIPTYRRPTTVAATVDRLLTNLVYDGPLHILVSDDSPEGSGATLDALKPLVTRHDLVGRPAEVAERGRSALLFNGPREGLGANLNHLLDLASTDLIFQLDDDHHLTGPLNLTPHAQTLLHDERAGFIRLMGVAGHRYVADLGPYGEQLPYWRVAWPSPDLYIPSFRPHLKHRRFHDYYGRYPVGLRLGQTEEVFCHQCKDKALRAGGPAVLIPLCQNDEVWEHVGESWQQQGL